MLAFRSLKIIRIISILFIVLLICIPVQAKYSGGTGVPNNPYQISEPNDWIELMNTSSDWAKIFIMTSDIDMNGVSLTPVGTSSSKAFKGIFDGNDFIIYHATMNMPDSNYVGLFGYVDSKGQISNLGLKYENITGKNYVGGLVGSIIDSDVTNCYSTGTVSGYNFVGGLVGYNDGDVLNCYSTETVSGNYHVGGLVGQNKSSLVENNLVKAIVSQCYSNGTASGNNEVGGLVGTNDHGDVTNCYSTGTVSGYYFVGGLVGDTYDGIAVVDYNGQITNCYSTGTVVCNVRNSYVGGLVGYWGYSYSRGGTPPTIPPVFDSFWDIETSGQTTSAGGTGKTTAQMKMAGTFAGWWFGSIWTIDEGKDYPHLYWEDKPGEPIPFPYGGGSGTSDNPYLIHTANQFNNIGLMSTDLDKHFKLMADIDMAGFDGREGRPAFNIINTFSGVFDGNDHTISHLTINGVGDLGLFGRLQSGATVKNLGVIDVNIVGSGSYIGGLVGENYGTLTQCYSTGTVTGINYVGGLVGYKSSGTMTQCYSAGTVTGKNYIGGLVGFKSSGTMTQCYSASVADGNDFVGGLVGYNYQNDDVNNCYNTGTVSGHNFVGGLVGYNYHGIGVINCYNTGKVSGNNYIGGLVGGNSDGCVTNCYSTGTVSGYNMVGGLVGANYPNGCVTNCYSFGAVSGNDRVGGLVGYIEHGDVNSCFWDIETSGQLTSARGTGKTTAKMKTKSTFTDAGWDFVGETVNGPNDIWSICEGTNYPRLVWQIPKGDFICPDGITIEEDFDFFFNHWGNSNCDSSNGYCDGTDLDLSGTVDFDDFLILINQWLAENQ